MRIATTVCASVALSVLASSALAQGLPRASATDKGSLIVFPKVEIQWVNFGSPTNPNWVITTDTFVDISNDYPGDVNVQMYFVNGDEAFEKRVCWPNNMHNRCHDDAECAREDPNDFCERTHLGWNWVDVKILLTAHQPTYWSAASGSNRVSPFTILDPASPPGRPCSPAGGHNAGTRCLRGFIIAFAVNDQGVPIRWNHLKGDAMIVHYEGPFGPGAESYNAYSFSALWGPDGSVNVEYPEFVANPDDEVTHVELLLDGVLYEAVPQYLLYDFYAEKSEVFSRRFDGKVSPVLEVWNELTLMPMDIDLRQETEGPTVTKATFTLWNENEIKFTGMDRCISCWDQEWLINYDAPNHFLYANLGTDKGKAQIDGFASQRCNDDGHDEDDPDDDIISVKSAMLGLARVHLLRGGAPAAAVQLSPWVGHAAHNLVGVGAEAASIKIDVTSRPPPEVATESEDLRTGSLEKMTPRNIR